MSLRVGIVGLPNVGKSTLFNALTKQAVQARNVPFTTIEPNVGVVPVPDGRLVKLTELSKSEKTTPTIIEFVDIAGLVKGAHKGEGLGNQFLANIRQVDAVVHVVRFFDTGEIIHIDSTVDPVRDAETINIELALADLTTVEKVLERNEKLARGQDPASAKGYGGRSKEARVLEILKELYALLSQGKPARDLKVDKEDAPLIDELFLLTRKPMLYVANVSESQIQNTEEVTHEFVEKIGPVLALSVKIEQEIVELSDEDKKAFLAEYGLTQTGLDRLIQAGYQLLNLITFLTTGPTESRAWTVTAGSTAPQAAGKIHSDMERGFIRAETVAYDDLIAAGSYSAARAAGKVRDEGKEYIVKDGDVMLFKFSV